MEMNLTQLCGLDPMIDDSKILVRCISIWKSHPLGKPNEVFSLEGILQDQQGNRVQLSVKGKQISKFQLLLDEGACYCIGNFGVGDNSGKYPLLKHRYKVIFYQGTTVTRVGSFDLNSRGFKFEQFIAFTTRTFVETELCEVGSLNVVSLMLGVTTKPYVQPSMYATKLSLNDDILEIAAFRQRYAEKEGFNPANRTIAKYTLVKKEITADDFCKDSDGPYHCILYVKIHKIHCEMVGPIWPVKNVVVLPKRYLLMNPLPASHQWRQCHKLIQEHGPNYDDYFPPELNVLVGKHVLWRFHYTYDHIQNNNHLYQIKLLTMDESMVSRFNIEFMIEDGAHDMQTPLLDSDKTSRFSKVANIPFNIEESPLTADGKSNATGANENGEGNSKDTDNDGGDSGGSGSGKRTVIDLDDYVEEAAIAKRNKVI